MNNKRWLLFSSERSNLRVYITSDLRVSKEMDVNLYFRSPLESVLDRLDCFFDEETARMILSVFIMARSDMKYELKNN